MLERKKESTIKTLLLALLVMALWGTLFPMIKVGYSAFHIATTDIPSIIVFAGTRFTLSGVFLIALEGVRQKRIELPKKGNMPYVALGALSTIILHYSFTYIGLAVGEGSKGAIVKQVGVLFLSCFAFLFDKDDKFSVNKVIAGVLGFGGIIATAFDGTGFSLAFGDVLLLLASGCSSVGTVVTKKATQTLSPIKYTGYSQLLGGIFLLSLGLLLGGRIRYISIPAVLVFLYICGASIGAYIIWSSLLRTGSISRLSVIKFTEPLFAVIFSGMILGEHILKVSYLVAFVLLLLALLVEHRPRRLKNEG